MAYEFASRLETFPKYRKFETTLRAALCGRDRQNVRSVQWQRDDPLRRDLRAVQCHDERQAA